MTEVDWGLVAWIGVGVLMLARGAAILLQSMQAKRTIHARSHDFSHDR